MNRRTFIQLASANVIAHLTGCGGGGGSSGGMGNGGSGGMDNSGTTIINSTQAKRPLPIPPLLTGTNFNLSLQAGNSSFLDGKTTPTYGINGNFLGPTLKVRDGAAVTLNVTNNLAENSTLHWHGMHVPGNQDGGPHQVIAPGATWNAAFTVKQKAGTNWFHPHGEGQTGRMVYQGLAGLLIVEDADTDTLDLPKTWGEDDIPVILQDRRFNTDGSFAYLSSMMDEMNGMLGDTILTNGTVNAEASLPAKEVRLRLLNGSNARVYNVAFSDGRGFRQIATDTALLETPVSLAAITLSPGERAEIVVDLTPDFGKQIFLLDTLSNGNLLTLTVNKFPASPTALPAFLAALPRLDPATAVRTRTFSLTMQMGMPMRFLINGQTMDMTRIDQIVPLNDVEIWEIRNDETDGMTHNFHVHGTHFQIVERDGSAANVAAYEKGFKDTVRIPSGGRVKIILQMTDYTTDATAPYMFHCHILEHEDRGMMGQFIVV